MKKSFVLIGMVLAVLVTQKIAKADIGPNEPECPLELSNDPYSNDADCKVIEKKIEIELGRKFTDSFYLISEISGNIFCPVDARYFELVKNDEISGEPDINNFGRGEYKLIAIDKQYMDSHGGINGIFQSKTIKINDGECNEYSIMSPKDPNAFKKNAFDVVVRFFPRGGELAWYGMDEKYLTRNKEEANIGYTDFWLFPVPAAYQKYPYLIAPITSPVISKKFVFSPNGLYCDKDECRMLFYKSKEIWKLDNGKEKTYPFEPKETKYVVNSLAIESAPIVVEEKIVPVVENNVTVSQVIPQKTSWEKFKCFFIGLFGSKC